MSHKSVAGAIPRVILAILTASALMLVSGQSLTSRRTSGARKMSIHHSPRMPENTTVAITAVRNLEGDLWLRNLELELQNNFDRPIYYLEVDLTFPEISTTDVDGFLRTLVIPIRFGRDKLMNEKALRPGEKLVLKVPEENCKSVESHLAKRNITMSAITVVRLRIYELSFGDGTGYDAGEPFINKQSRRERARLE